MAPSLGFVDLSVINGEVIVKDGKLLTVDLQVCASTYYLYLYIYYTYMLYRRCSI